MSNIFKIDSLSERQAADNIADSYEAQEKGSAIRRRNKRIAVRNRIAHLIFKQSPYESG